MARGEVFPVVNCADLLGTLEWYRRVLSAEVAYRFPDDGEPDYVALRVGSGQVALGRGTVPALYGQTPLPASGHAVDICVYVPDLDTVVAASAGDVVVPPSDMPWGERVCYLQDPAGTMLLVIQDAPVDAP